MDPELPHDFKEFLKLLNSHSVEYLLIGGYAVGYYGYPRATNDLDIWIAMNDENAVRVVETLREFGFDTPELSAELFLKPDNIVRMGSPPVRIEILTTISGLRFAESWPHRKDASLGDVQVTMIGLPCLKTNKRASGRHKDLDDLEHLP